MWWVVAFFAVLNLGQGSYIFAKAHLAQWLIEDAWQHRLLTKEIRQPWPWADTTPVAKITLNGQKLVVLEGANHRNLAFGPTHLQSTPMPGEKGNSIILGHRDTHFAELSNLVVGDSFSLNSLSSVHQFEVSDIRIVHKDQLSLPVDHDIARLTLITCYPFDAIASSTPFRYVVLAEESPDQSIVPRF